MGFNLFQQEWSDPASGERREIVFESKNKKYGAYHLRRSYSANLLLALFVAISSVTLAFVIPFLIHRFGSTVLIHTIQSEEITLAEPPVEKEIPMPPVIIPLPVQQTIKFTPPVIVKDELMEEPPPSQEETKNTVVSTVTQEGANTEVPPPENPVVQEPEDKTFTIVEEMPSFPGGEKKMIEFILSNIHYPPVALENNIAGKVYVKFTVDKEGKICSPELLRGIGGGCDEEAMRILKMMPDWTPGRQNGNKVKVGGIVLHIDFSLR